MASKTRGPGIVVGDTEASNLKKKPPLKSKPDNSQTRRRAQRKNLHRPAETQAGARRTYTVYNGRVLLGTFVWNERTQEALAWNASRRFVGRFGSYQAAAQAIGRAAVTAPQTAEARRRLDDPHPPFVTGLSEQFLGRG
jgi:hypothetical protein